MIRTKTIDGGQERCLPLRPTLKNGHMTCEKKIGYVTCDVKQGKIYSLGRFLTCEVVKLSRGEICVANLKAPL